MTDAIPTLRIAGLCGSLRAQSYNMVVLKAAGTLMPEGMRLDIASIGDLPLYDADVQARGFPEAVTRLAATIRAADAVLIASPEYNYSVPGVLKNAIDWASRSPNQPFNGKPIAIMGASGGPMGTGRAQYHLRQIFVCLNAFTMNKPEVLVASASTKFDAAGNLTDQETREKIRKLLEALSAWTERLRSVAPSA